MIDLSQDEKVVDTETTLVESEEKDKREFYSSVVWQFVQDEFLHELLLVEKDEYCYSIRSRDGTERQILSKEEALWLTLDLKPELMSSV